MGDVVPLRTKAERGRSCPSCSIALPTTFHMNLDVPGRFFGCIRSMRTRSVTIDIVCICGEQLRIVVHNKAVEAD